MKLSKVFIRNLDYKKAMPYIIFLVVCVVSEIVATIMIPSSRKPVYDALEKTQVIAFYWGLGLYIGVYLWLSISQGLKTWLAHKVALFAREALMHSILPQWVARGAKADVTNPDSRLNDDIRVATDGLGAVSVELIISGSIVIGLMFQMMDQPFLLLAAMVYSGISVGLATFFNKSMVRTRYNNLNAEGEHRTALTKLSIGHDDTGRSDMWEAIKDTYTQYIAVLRNYKYFSALQTALMIGAPFLILAPSYFSHQITLGDMIKGITEFDLVVVNAAIWVQLYPQIMDIRTALLRVKEMYIDVTQ